RALACAVPREPSPVPRERHPPSEGGPGNEILPPSSALTPAALLRIELAGIQKAVLHARRHKPAATARSGALGSKSLLNLRLQGGDFHRLHLSHSSGLGIELTLLNLWAH